MSKETHTLLYLGRWGRSPCTEANTAGTREHCVCLQHREASDATHWAGYSIYRTEPRETLKRSLKWVPKDPKLGQLL